MRRGGLVGRARALARPPSEAEIVAAGVHATAEKLAAAGIITEHLLWWVASTQYMAEMIAPALCRQRRLSPDREDDVAAYFSVAFRDYAAAMITDFDVVNFEAWIAQQEEGYDPG